MFPSRVDISHKEAYFISNSILPPCRQRKSMLMSTSRENPQMSYSPIANGFGSHVFLQNHLQYSMVYRFSQLHKKCQLTLEQHGDKRALLHRICCRQSGDKIFRIWFPRCVYIFPCCKVWHRKLNRRYANEKAANRHLMIPVSSQRLSRAAGGIISVDYYTVSDVVIKSNQEADKKNQ